MCGRGRFAVLAACLLSQYAQPCRRKRKGRNSASNAEQSSSASKAADNKDTSVKEEVPNSEVEFPTTENLSPGMECPVLYKVEDSDGSRLVAENMIWGIIPTYLNAPTANDHYRMFNKRIESLERSEVAPYFKTVVQTKRCVVFLDGFYEWKMVAGKKHPYYVSLGPSEPMKMAGIYEDSTIFDPKIYGMRQAKTFSIVTSDSCAKFSSVHTRQPVLLTGEQVTRWLDCPAEEVFSLLEELKQNRTQDLPMNKAIQFHPVNPKVTNPRYQEVDCSTYKAIGAQLTAFFKASASPISMSSSNISNANARGMAGSPLVRTASQRTDTTEMLPSALLDELSSGTEAKESLTDDEDSAVWKLSSSAVLGAKINAAGKTAGDGEEHGAVRKRAKHQHDACAQSPVKPATSSAAAAVTPTKTATTTSSSTGARITSSPGMAAKKAGPLAGAKAAVGKGRGSPAAAKLRPITSFFAPSPKK